MKDAPETQRLSDTSRGVAPSSEEESCFFLVRALDLESETTGAARHSLRDVREVRIERGTEAPRTIREDDHAVLVLQIPDNKLSARHARLSWEGLAWAFEDLGSTNGSVVSGSPVSHAELSDGDIIELGSTVFLFRRMNVPVGLIPDKEVSREEAGGFVTLSPALEDTVAHIARIAPSALPVLLLGETGTGKDVLAHAVHDLSKRTGPFVPVNCGGIPATLIEALLFGHTKGAFTGATRDEPGFVRAAHGGTLFLDEIADLPPASQAALLRVLQSGEVIPVGSTKPEYADVRVVAATHRNLADLMTAGAFRQDLYARLAGFVSVIPPLRERPEDLGLLIRVLLTRHARGGAIPTLKMDAARALFTYSWPLNVRELEQCLAAAMVLSEGDAIRRHHLPIAVREASRSGAPPALASSAAPPARSPEDEATWTTLVGALRDTGGNVSETARRLGKARQQVQRWLRRYGLDPAKFQDPTE